MVNGHLQSMNELKLIEGCSGIERILKLIVS